MIRVEDVSKQYRLGQISTGSLAHDVNRWWHTLRGKQDPYLKIGEENDRTVAGTSEYVWALQDISFDVKQGEVLGIIGRNGAGKSTLLKILSRTTLPSTGTVKAKGRIASLLEVGTGFHPELTGRENIFLNGAILGMTKREIASKFDEIVDFSGVEKYIDTPVKRYSSGMYVRLAFAVAAHLEPEILIVDEVLAVGDADFQKKCLGKMKDVSSQGRTVLFVSHNMSAIKTLCSRAIGLKNGNINLSGDVVEVVDSYFESGTSNILKKTWQPNEAIGDDIVRLYSARLTDSNHNDIDHVDFYEGARIEIIYRVLKEGFTSIPNFHFFKNDEAIFIISEDKSKSPKNHGLYKSSVILPPHFLNEGKFSVGIAVTSYPLQVVNFYENPCLTFEVIEHDLSNRKFPYTGSVPGFIRPELDWKTEMIE